MNLRWKLCNLRQLKAFGPIFGKNLKYYFTAVRFGAQALGALAIETLAPVLWVQTNSTRCRLLGGGINHTIRTHLRSRTLTRQLVATLPSVRCLHKSICGRHRRV